MADKPKIKNAQHLNMLDYLASGFQGDGAAQHEYLQNKADAKKAKAEAEARDVERLRRQGKKSGV